MIPNNHMSRPAQLMAITVEAMRQLPGGVMSFADRVTEHYLATVPEDQRRAPIKPIVGDLDQMDKTQRANRQTINRYITGEVKSFPADLEDSWVLSLPAASKERALRELAARVGLLAARAPEPSSAVTCLGEIMRDAGALLQRMAPIVADGCINGADQPHIKPALAAVSDLLAELASMQAQLIAAMPPEQGGNVVAMRSAG